MYSYDRVLPIGSVVLLKGANKRLMILGYQKFSMDEDDKKVYDYCGCSFPEGYMSPEKTAIFDHEDIERIIFVGLQSSVQDKMADLIRKTVAERESDQLDAGLQ